MAVHWNPDGPRYTPQNSEERRLIAFVFTRTRLVPDTIRPRCRKCQKKIRGAQHQVNNVCRNGK